MVMAESLWHGLLRLADVGEGWEGKTGGGGDGRVVEHV